MDALTKRYFDFKSEGLLDWQVSRDWVEYAP
jgi:hypothetical protein